MCNCKKKVVAPKNVVKAAAPQMPTVRKNSNGKRIIRRTIK